MRRSFAASIRLRLTEIRPVLVGRWRILLIRPRRLLLVRLVTPIGLRKVGPDRLLWIGTLVIWRVGPLWLLNIRGIRPLRLLNIWRNGLVRPRRLVVGRDRLVWPVLIRIVGTSALLVVGTTVIGPIHLRRVPAILLLLVIRRQRSSSRLRRLLALVWIRGRLIGLIAGTFDSTLYRFCRIGARNSERRLVLPIVWTLLLIALSSRELVLGAATIGSGMRRRSDDSAPGQWPPHRSLANRGRDRYCSRFGGDFLPALVDQHRTLHFHWYMRDGTSNDRARWRGDGWPLKRPDLLHLSRVDFDCDIAYTAARTEIVAAHGGHVRSVDVGDVGDVHHVHVVSLYLNAAGGADVGDVDLVDIARAAPVPRPVRLAGA